MLYRSDHIDPSDLVAVLHVVVADASFIFLDRLLQLTKLVIQAQVERPEVVPAIGKLVEIRAKSFVVIPSELREGIAHSSR